MADVYLEYVDDVNIKVKADPGIIMELADTLTFKKKNAHFSPKFSRGGKKGWDGNIHMLNRLSGVTYGGLAKRIKKFCDNSGYTFAFDDRLLYDNVSEHEVVEFIKALKLPDWIDIRDYQVETVTKALRARRLTLQSPTSSGKSLMIYLIASWYRRKTLIIVPTSGLVLQFTNDIRSYGFKGTIHTSVDGLDDKAGVAGANIVITTWQSLENGKKKMPAAWYNQFDVVFGDEAHGVQATCFKNILGSMRHTPYRFGTSGTFPDDDPLGMATIEGLLGPTIKTISTREMIDQGYASDIKIKCLIMQYKEELRKDFHKSISYIDEDTGETKQRKRTYAEEIDFLVNYRPRNIFIKNLVLSLKGNRLVFFRRKEHGKILYDLLKDQGDVFYIDGDVPAAERERMRCAIEEKEDAILIASMGTTAEGVSIKRMHYMIAATPTKSKIKLLQSIGRMLRQHAEKTHAVLFDISDDLTWKSKENFTLAHFKHRIEIYDKEEFQYKIYTIGLK